jgi:hypothetical protein
MPALIYGKANSIQLLHVIMVIGTESLVGVSTHSSAKYFFNNWLIVGFVVSNKQVTSYFGKTQKKWSQNCVHNI